jgi:hypothetical protein
VARSRVKWKDCYVKKKEGNGIWPTGSIDMFVS